MKIFISGAQGSGKTFVARHLADWLSHRGYSVTMVDGEDRLTYRPVRRDSGKRVEIDVAQGGDPESDK